VGALVGQAAGRAGRRAGEADRATRRSSSHPRSSVCSTPKEPEELAYLFLAISVGLGLGAGQALLTIVALAAIVGLIVIRGLLVRRTPDQPNLYLTVSSPAPRKLRPAQLMEALTGAGVGAVLKRLDETPEMLEASFVADFRQVGRLEDFSERVRNLDPNATVRCLDDRGLGV
jgi:hypothetical protein